MSRSTEPVEDDDPTVARLKVAVRIRPMTTKEITRDNAYAVLKALDDQNILVSDPSEDYADVLRQDRPREKVFTYERVFAETAEQMEVFENTTKFLIDHVLRGFNTTVFAYGMLPIIIYIEFGEQMDLTWTILLGATGAGKTYTMLGTDTNPGVMALTLAHLFTEIANARDPESYKVSVSYMEIYNENIRDLLSGKPDYLDVREDANGEVVVAGITQESAKSAEDVLGCLQKGNRNRTQEATGANEVSSRSHAVLQVFVGHRILNKKGHHIERFGKLSMIDLAGSERAADTHNRGMRMIEGASINRSLLALGNCINALGESGTNKKYVNYRDSKLTRLLKDSLGGNCRTVMIANVSPANINFEETCNTLKYASRARMIRNKVAPLAAQKCDPYITTVLKLQTEIGQLKNKLASQSENMIAAPYPRGHLQKEESSYQLTHSRSGSNTHRGQINSRGSGISTAPQDSSMLAECQTALEGLFSEQLELRLKRVEAQEMEEKMAEAIFKKTADMKKASGAVAKKGSNAENALNEYRAILEKMDAKKKKAAGARAYHTKQMAEYDDRIKGMQQTLPRSLDRRSRQYLDLMIKSHFMEIDNLDLSWNYSHSTNSLKKKELELHFSYNQIALYEKITSMQRELLKKAEVPIPDKLVVLYDELHRLNRDDDVPKSSTSIVNISQRNGKNGMIQGIDSIVTSSSLPPRTPTGFNTDKKSKRGDMYILPAEQDISLDQLKASERSLNQYASLPRSTKSKEGALKHKKSKQRTSKETSAKGRPRKKSDAYLARREADSDSSSSSQSSESEQSTPVKKQMPRKRNVKLAKSTPKIPVGGRDNKEESPTGDDDDESDSAPSSPEVARRKPQKKKAAARAPISHDLSSSLTSSTQSVDARSTPISKSSKSSKPSNMGAIAKTTQSSKVQTLSEAREEMRRSIRRAREERLREQNWQSSSLDSRTPSSSSVAATVTPATISSDSLVTGKSYTVKAEERKKDLSRVEAMRAAYGMGVPVALKRPLLQQTSLEISTMERAKLLPKEMRSQNPER
ncbi:Protein CBR-klp-13 [Chytridiales sp. JEL 0842]|nr:Protein CBR-klp-13 [Chytridiales sp. JEL 0842]